MTRDKVRKLLEAGKTSAEIARQLGLSPATICYHKRRLGFPLDVRGARRHDWEEIQRLYDAGHSLRQCQAEFGFSRKSWYDAVQRGAIVPRPQAAPIEEILRRDRKRDRHHVKSRLLAAGLKTNECEECGLTEWRDEPISMALHHVNGDGRDNRIENLALLCPNCHSQTPNFGVKNWKARSAAVATRTS
jgi:5-methylcytosine-specific restriction endonuclease McrA